MRLSRQAFFEIASDAWQERDEIEILENRIKVINTDAGDGE